MYLNHLSLAIHRNGAAIDIGPRHKAGVGGGRRRCSPGLLGIVILSFAFPSLASANLILVSESRAVTTWATNIPGSTGPVVSTRSSGDFAPFTAEAAAVAAGGSARAGQISTITPDEITLHSGVSVFVGSGEYSGGLTQFVEAFASSYCEVGFLLAAPTFITISAYNSFLSGDAHLFSSSGEIPLLWGGGPFGNFLEFSQVLAPGSYTLTSRQALDFLASGNQLDGRTQEFELTLQAAGSVAGVPDAGSTAELLAVILAGVMLVRAHASGCRASTSARASLAIAGE